MISHDPYEPRSEPTPWGLHHGPLAHLPCIGNWQRRPPWRNLIPASGLVKTARRIDGGRCRTLRNGRLNPARDQVLANQASLSPLPSHNLGPSLDLEHKSGNFHKNQTTTDHAILRRRGCVTISSTVVWTYKARNVPPHARGQRLKFQTPGHLVLSTLRHLSKRIGIAM